MMTILFLACSLCATEPNPLDPKIDPQGKTEVKPIDPNIDAMEKIVSTCLSGGFGSDSWIIPEARKKEYVLYVKNHLRKGIDADQTEQLRLFPGMDEDEYWNILLDHSVPLKSRALFYHYFKNQSTPQNPKVCTNHYFDILSFIEELTKSKDTVEIYGYNNFRGWRQYNIFYVSDLSKIDQLKDIYPDGRMVELITPRRKISISLLEFAVFKYGIPNSDKKSRRSLYRNLSYGHAKEEITDIIMPEDRFDEDYLKKEVEKRKKIIEDKMIYQPLYTQDELELVRPKILASIKSKLENARDKKSQKNMVFEWREKELYLATFYLAWSWPKQGLEPCAQKEFQFLVSLWLNTMSEVEYQLPHDKTGNKNEARAAAAANEQAYRALRERFRQDAGAGALGEKALDLFPAFEFPELPPWPNNWWYTAEIPPPLPPECITTVAQARAFLVKAINEHMAKRKAPVLGFPGQNDQDWLDRLNFIQTCDPKTILIEE